jgi:hypothetical protein
MRSFKQYILTEKVITVYHGTGVYFDKFSFDNAPQKIIWFTSDREGIINKEKGAQTSGYILTLKVNIKNPAGWDEYDKLGLDELQRNGFDGAILEDSDGHFDGFVFKRSQVKIIDREKI